METPLDPKQARLLAYLDGELEAGERAQVEAELASDEAMQAELDRLVRLQDLLAAAPSAFAAPDPGELAFERIRRNVNAAIDGAAEAAPAPASSAPAKVVPLDRARRSRRTLFGGFVAAAAAAAVLAVSFGAPGTGEIAHHDPATVRVPSHAAMNGTEIVRVEFGKMSGTYWEQNEGDDRVAIVWIDDTMPEEVGRP